MDDILDFCRCVLLPVICIGCFIAALGVGCVFANSEWNCSTWHANTGEQVKVMAAECYVKEPHGWVSFDTHVKNHHIQVSDQ